MTTPSPPPGTAPPSTADLPAPTKTLQYLLSDLATVPPARDPDIRALTLHSRHVAPDHLFIAIPGTTTDGRAHITDALNRGAAAVICEAAPPHTPFPALPETAVPIIAIPHLRRNLGAIASRFYDHPSKTMQIIGITGTNGKTTVAGLLAQALNQLGTPTAIMGTLGAGFINDLRPQSRHAPSLTTADAITTHRTLAALRARGAEAVCIEASSHGLAQSRLAGVAIDVAVFTNISHDHLDYHHTMERYRRAKQRLFHFPDLRHAVINLDHPFSRHLATVSNASHCISYGLRPALRRSPYRRPAPHLRAHNPGFTLSGIVFQAHWRNQSIPVQSPLLGALNLPNLLAVFATCIALGHPLPAIASAARRCYSPPGRMQRISPPNDTPHPIVVVDYAHTPDALSHAIDSLRPLCRGKLRLLFGCGGDRDPTKRIPMAAAATVADHIILTDDNPRSEDPKSIIAELASSPPFTNMSTPLEIIHGRKLAIHRAIYDASPDDIVLIAGKGHETTQQIAGKSAPLNDRTLAATALKARDHS